MSNPYAVMGVSPTASDEDIAKAYRVLAKKYHPDLYPGDKNATERMSAINTAYEEIKSMRQSGNRQNSKPQKPQRDYEPQYGYGTQYASSDSDTSAWGTGFDPFAYYRQSQYSGQRRPRKSFGGVMFFVFMITILFQLLLGVLSGGFTYDSLFSSGSDGYSYQMPYGYYQAGP